MTRALLPVLFLSVTCASGIGCVSIKEVRSNASPATQNEKRAPLPIFVMDKKDSEANGIECIFVHSSDAETEFTIVFKDEDPSWFGLPTLCLSEPKRFLCYRRVADVESFKYLHPKGPKDVVQIHFERTYAGNQPYSAFWPKHYTACIPASQFEHVGERPIIFITTWNHMLSDTPRDLATRKRTRIDSYPLYRGSRIHVDTLFKNRDPEAE